MIKTIFALTLMMLATLPAQAAMPTAAQKQDFYNTCMGIAQNAPLCACKADAAMTLIDDKFMALVIASMKGTAPPADSYVAYNDYVAKSNQVCKPGY